VKLILNLCLCNIEPTTGLDPVSRRHVWEAINCMKQSRVVVLTTHNMEEADFLGDTIMIMHSGHVRAFGDPLFLKQTYGKGYHVNVVVNKSHMQEAQGLIKQALPESDCSLNENSGEIIVTVPRGDVRGLPRLFSWLESSVKASAVVKEWSVSNTTLEQVFLMLCVQNTEINYVESNVSDEYKRTTCPMCNIRPRETVFMRNVDGILTLVPESICVVCSYSNPHYYVAENDVIDYRSSPNPNEFMHVLLSNAQTKAESAANKAILAIEEQRNDDFSSDTWKDVENQEGVELLPRKSKDENYQLSESANNKNVESNQLANPTTNYEDPYARTAHGDMSSQVLHT
jgi:energy-coupling factor transporter ATP-binding protein EcfA2